MYYSQKNTTVYICGTRFPFKEDLLLPNCRQLSEDTVRRALVRQNKKRLPTNLPSGSFHCLFDDSVKQVCLYKFTNTYGCGTIASPAHGKLINIRNPSGPAGIKYQDLGLARKYLYLDSNLGSAPGFDIPDMFSKHTIKKVVETKESGREDMLIDEIQQHYPNLTVQRWGGIDDRYCEFGGGGDVVVYPQNMRRSLCIYIPRRIYTGTIELKFTTYSVSALELQLQANMMLLASKSLANLLEFNNDVDIIIVYGLAFGVFHELVLLKMEMNFTTGSTVFTYLFTSHPNPNYHIAVDSALAYIVEQLQQ